MYVYRSVVYLLVDLAEPLTLVLSVTLPVVVELIPFLAELILPVALVAVLSVPFTI